MSRPGNCLIIDNFSVEVGRINTAIRLSVEKALEKITDHDVTTQDYWKKSQKDGTYEAILKAGLIAEMHLTIATSKLVDAHSPSTLKGKKLSTTLLRKSLGRYHVAMLQIILSC